MTSRLPPIDGEWIDRNQLLDFTFEGKRFWGYAGDTVTSALCASGQHILGRSFKYHRPRGILSFANHDINALMQSGQELNLRADVTPLAAGMSLAAINTFGGVMSDRASVYQLFRAVSTCWLLLQSFSQQAISFVGAADPQHRRTRQDRCFHAPHPYSKTL